MGVLQGHDEARTVSRMANPMLNDIGALINRIGLGLLSNILLAILVIDYLGPIF